MKWKTAADPRWRREWQPCWQALGKLCSFSYVLFVFCCLRVSCVSITVYDSDTLLNIGSSVAQHKPDFEFFDVVINVGGISSIAWPRQRALMPCLWHPVNNCLGRAIEETPPTPKRGKRAGVLVRLRRRAFRPSLPTILLANVQCHWITNSANWRSRILIPTRNRTAVLFASQKPGCLLWSDSAIELSNTQLQRHRQICRWHNGDRPDHDNDEMAYREEVSTPD